RHFRGVGHAWFAGPGRAGYIVKRGMDTQPEHATNAARTVGVVGCGTMGSGIAEACARAGHRVVVRVLDETHLKAGRTRIEDSLGRAVAQGRLEAADRDTALERIT